ncbi:unnamed protein product [Protopolystoma xenopodis]|uniref:Uncharacterized protein n=1 Tax=Protopolystoma xenopodis TaxID=117903 RepID=A0A3S5BQU5_9PLAT|nr:unnamed protein product [Protopolystoma xenopodis]
MFIRLEKNLKNIPSLASSGHAFSGPTGIRLSSPLTIGLGKVPLPIVEEDENEAGSTATASISPATPSNAVAALPGIATSSALSRSFRDNQNASDWLLASRQRTGEQRKELNENVFLMASSNKEERDEEDVLVEEGYTSLRRACFFE